MCGGLLRCSEASICNPKQDDDCLFRLRCERDPGQPTHAVSQTDCQTGLPCLRARSRFAIFLAAAKSTCLGGHRASSFFTQASRPLPVRSFHYISPLLPPSSLLPLSFLLEPYVRDHVRDHLIARSCQEFRENITKYCAKGINVK